MPEDTHDRGQRLLSATLPLPTAKALSKAARKREFTPTQWRSLIFNATSQHTRAQLAAGEWTPEHIVRCVHTDSRQLAPPTIKAQRTEKLQLRTPAGVQCPQCKRDTLVVEFVHRSTGPGRKREEVRIANCSHCHHREVPE